MSLLWPHNIHNHQRFTCAHKQTYNMKGDRRRDIRGNEQVSMCTHEGKGVSKKHCILVKMLKWVTLYTILYINHQYITTYVLISVLLLIFVTIQQTLTKERPSNKISKRQLKLDGRISIVGWNLQDFTRSVSKCYS